MGVKVVYNSDFGGFSLSGKAICYFMELKGKTIFAYHKEGNTYRKIENPTNEDFDDWDVATFDKDFGKSFNNYGPEHDDHYVSGYISTEGDYPRHDPELVKTVEDLGSKANGSYAHLKIKELKGNLYLIDEYDGNERVVEPDDINWITVEEQDGRNEYGSLSEL